MTAHPTALLDAIADDPLPSRQDDRAAIELAIRACLALHDVVHISLVRDLLIRNVAPHMLGAVISATVTHGDFEWTGEYLPNGGPSRNAAKPAKVWRKKESS